MLCVVALCPPLAIISTNASDMFATPAAVFSLFLYASAFLVAAGWAPHRLLPSSRASAIALFGEEPAAAARCLYAAAVSVGLEHVFFRTPCTLLLLIPTLLWLELAQKLPPVRKRDLRNHPAALRVLNEMGAMVHSGRAAPNVRITLECARAVVAAFPPTAQQPVAGAHLPEHPARGAFRALETQYARAQDALYAAIWLSVMRSEVRWGEEQPVRLLLLLDATEGMEPVLRAAQRAVSCAQAASAFKDLRISSVCYRDVQYPPLQQVEGSLFVPADFAANNLARVRALHSANHDWREDVRSGLQRAQQWIEDETRETKSAKLVLIHAADAPPHEPQSADIRALLSGLASKRVDCECQPVLQAAAACWLAPPPHPFPLTALHPRSPPAKTTFSSSTPVLLTLRCKFFRSVRWYPTASSCCAVWRLPHSPPPSSFSFFNPWQTRALLTSLTSSFTS